MPFCKFKMETASWSEIFIYKLNIHIKKYCIIESLNFNKKIIYFLKIKTNILDTLIAKGYIILSNLSKIKTVSFTVFRSFLISDVSLYKFKLPHLTEAYWVSFQLQYGRSKRDMCQSIAFLMENFLSQICLVRRFYGFLIISHIFECYMLLSFGVRLISIYFLFLCPQHHSQFLGKHICFPKVIIYADCGNILSRFLARMKLIFLTEPVRGWSLKPCGLFWVVILYNLTSLLRGGSKGFFYQEEGGGGSQLEKKV